MAHRLIVILCVPTLLAAPAFSPESRADFVPADTPIADASGAVACDAPLGLEEQLWCRTRVPDSDELPVIAGVVARMRTMGGVCRRLAGKLTILLESGRVHLFDADEFPESGGLAPVGQGAASWMLISRDFVTRYFDRVHRSGNVDSRGVKRPQTLQSVLAHEADHLDGLRHLDHDGYLTANSLRCSDVAR